MMNYKISASFQSLTKGEILFNLIFWDFIHTLIPILVPFAMNNIPIVENVVTLAIRLLHELVTKVFVCDLN